MRIRKRDARVEDFSSSKLIKAISKCFDEVHNTNQALVYEIANSVQNKISDNTAVETIQDLVERELVSRGMYDEAKAYIIYRHDRAKARDANTQLTKIFDDINKIESSELDLKRENANIDTNTSMGTMLKIGTEASKDYNLKYLIKPKFAMLHENGDFHIHDLDFYSITMNCLFIPLAKLLKSGFNTGHGTVREPQSIKTAANLACIVLQSNQNEMFGGQAFPTFDYDLAPYVAKSFANHLRECLNDYFDSEDTEKDFKNILTKEITDKIYQKYNTILNLDSKSELSELLKIDSEIFEKLYKRALKKTDKETYQAMEALIHNFNTMHSRAGAQTPFSSINYGTCTSEEGRMIVKNVLLATDKGLGRSETPIFPVQIFKLKRSVNTQPDSKNYDLFKLAIKTSAKRLFPNFTFCDSPYNAQYYKEGHPETEIAVMGCRTRVIGNTYDKDHEQVTGRGNFSFNTLNLPRLGILAKGDLKKFFTDLDNLIDDAIQQLKDRFDYIGNKHVYNYPFLMGQGVYLDSDKYGPNDTIREILKQSSISVGFCGLAECLVALTGKHHGESEEAQELGLKIIRHIRKRMDEESKKTGLSWSCFATPAESTAGTFLRKDRKIFGVIPGVTDRDYYTNSFHVPVYYKTSILHKIDVESPYHEICNAGSISYIELDGDPNKNLDAYEAIVRYAAKKNLQYFSINTQNDQCPVCGYLGIIGDECPHCGFREDSGVSVEHLKELGIYDEVLNFNK